MKIPLYIYLILLVNMTFGSTTIEVNNPAYAGKELHFFKYSDPVTTDKIPVFSLKINSEGFATEKIQVNGTIFVWCDFDIYRGMLFLEQDKSCELLLPPVREKSFSDEKNPYFESVEFWFLTKSGEALNDKISEFDSKMNSLTGKYFNQLYFNQSESAFDSLSLILDRDFNQPVPETFRIHKELKLKAVEADVLRFSPSQISEMPAKVDPAFWEHPAFIELFEKAYSNKLSFESKSALNRNLMRAVNQGDIKYISNFLMEKYHLTGMAADLALLKLLHDGYYSGDFYENAILYMIASEKFSANTNSRIREISLNVLNKLQHLRKGTPAPVICLNNTNGNKVCSNSDNGKFKYLIFADTEMIVCREHLKYLTRIDEQFSNNLEIIIVLKKTDIIEMKIFLDKQKIPGIHLVDESGKYTEDYKVRAFPLCLLLNNKHEVVLKQAKAPLDGFEQQFRLILQQR